MSLLQVKGKQKIRGRPRKDKTEMGAFANQMRMTRQLKNFLDSEKHNDESYSDEILRIIRAKTEMIANLRRQLDRLSNVS